MVHPLPYGSPSYGFPSQRNVDSWFYLPSLLLHLVPIKVLHFRWSIRGFLKKDVVVAIVALELCWMVDLIVLPLVAPMGGLNDYRLESTDHKSY